MSFAQFGNWWRMLWANHFGMSRISNPGEGSNTSDVVRIAPASNTQQELAINLTRAETFGDVICPPAEAPSYYLTLGPGGVSWPGATQQRPTDGKAGDRGLYCSQDGARIHLYGANSANPGRVRIDSATGATPAADVVVNGGTHKVSRVGDHAKVTLRAEWVQVPPPPATPTGVSLTIFVVSDTSTVILTQFTIPGGVVDLPAAQGVPNDVEVDSVLFEGAEHFLG